MLGNDRTETAKTEAKSIEPRNDIEKSTWKTHRYFVDFESQIHVKFPRRIDVIISTWIRLSKSMKSQQTFQVEFRRWIDGESTKMCPLGVGFRLVHVLYVFIRIIGIRKLILLTSFN